MLIDRRAFVWGLGSWLFASSSAGRFLEGTLEPGVLPTPDFALHNVVRFVAGIRPYRRGSFRLEGETHGRKFVVHNYGHGGAGVTLSWGCAEEVLGWVRGRVAPPAEIAVLGAGVSGLTTARVLASHGYPVHLYGERFTPHTTSDLAGAQWAPALVASGSGARARHRWDRILRRSYSHFRRLIGSEFGVFERTNYVLEGHGGAFGRIPAGILPPPTRVGPLPFPEPRRRGRAYETLLIEPPTYLPRLFASLEATTGFTITPRRFRDLSEVLALPESIIVNCLGLGARAVFDDPRVVPIRGQLVHLEPQDLPYLLSHRGYLFPRRDVVVLGGSSERGVDDPTPDPEECYRILRRNWRFFHGPSRR